MHQRHAQFGELRGELFERGLRGLCDDLIAVVDERADPVGLPALAACGPDALHQLRTSLGTQHHRLHRGAARRQFVDRGHVEVGIRGHRERARDGRRGHHQLVRHAVAAASLVAQREALVHAEAMLLVDDRQREVMERHALLHQRVRADHQLGLATRDGRQCLVACTPRDLARQPHHADAQWLEPAAQVVEVLLGEQLGGGRQRGLLARIDRQQRRHRRDHGLAAADVALHQPQHRHGPCEVGADLAVHALLRARQCKGQRRAQRLDAGLAAQWRGAMRLHRDALATQAQVMRQQLFDREPALRGVLAREQRLQVGVRRRAMQREQRIAQGRQARAERLARGHRTRQQFERGVIGKRLQRLPDQLAQRRGPHALDRGIDRVQAVAQRGILACGEHAVTRVHHLQPELPGPRDAVGPHARAGRELGGLLGAEMEEPQQQRAAALVGQRDLEHRPPAEAALDRLDRSLDLRGLARQQQADRRDRGAVLVLARQVEPQVLQCQQATRGKLFRHLRANAAQRGQRLRGRIDKRCAGARGRGRARRGHSVARGLSAGP